MKKHKDPVQILLFDLIRYRRNWDRVHPFFWVIIFSFLLIFIGALIKGIGALMWIGGFVLFIFAACVGIWLRETLP